MDHLQKQCRLVTQPGVVAAVHGMVADIEIVQLGSCASCHVKSICAAGDGRRRLIQAPNRHDLKSGDRVDISMPERYGWLGVAFAFVIPLILVVAVLFGTANIFGSEELGALVGIGALVPYYGGLYVLRRRFARIVRFEATPTLGVVSRPMLGKEGIS